MPTTRPLDSYLQDHLMGASAGLALFHRAAANLPEVAPLVTEVARDREALLRILAAVGVRPDRRKVLAGRVAERVGRLKRNGRLLRRAPLSDVVELEALVLGVQGKLAGFRLLRALEDPRLAGEDLDGLVARAQGQADRLEQLRLRRGVEVLGS